MYCTFCGNQLPADARFCPVCGAATNAVSSPAPEQPAAPSFISDAPQRISAAPPPAPQAGASGAKRRKVLFVAAALLLVLVIAGAFYLFSDAHTYRRADGMLREGNISEAVAILRTIGDEPSHLLIDYLTQRQELLELASSPYENVTALEAFSEQYQTLSKNGDRHVAAQLQRDSDLASRAERAAEFMRAYDENEHYVYDLAESIDEFNRLNNRDSSSQNHGPEFTVNEERERLAYWAEVREYLHFYYDPAGYEASGWLEADCMYLDKMITLSERACNDLSERMDELALRYDTDSTIYYTSSISVSYAASDYYASPEEARRQLWSVIAHQIAHPRTVDSGEEDLLRINGARVSMTYDILEDGTAEVTGIDAGFVVQDTIMIPEMVRHRLYGPQLQRGIA